MNIIKETLEPVIERWDDPGDYPSNAGSGPLPSYDYVAEIDGDVTVEFEDEDLIELLTNTYEPDLPRIINVKWEVVKIEGRKVTFAVKDFDCTD